MIAIIIISFLALITAALAIFLKRGTLPDPGSNRVLEAPNFRGLFDHSDAPPLVKEPDARDSRQQLLELARAGDLNALSAAHASQDSLLYADVVDALSERAKRQEDLAALVSHISKSNDLRATRQLAQRLIENLKAAPDRRSTTAMIHIAALSDDAETYERAIETALELWRSGRLAGFSPEELAELFVSQYWVISPEARSGGVAFALKRRLSGIRRELATATPVR
jgi:hypothetical protein